MSEETKKEYAFPWATSTDTGHLGQGGMNEGMTLRDYFAAKALPVVIKLHSENITPYEAQGTTSNEEMAFHSYKIADAMLAQKNKTT